MKKLIISCFLAVSFLFSYSQDNNIELRNEYKNTGYKTILKLGVGNNQNGFFNTNPNFKLSLINGYRFKNNIFLGLNTGVKLPDTEQKNINSNRDNISCIVFEELYFRYNLSYLQSSPFIEASYGTDYPFLNSELIKESFNSSFSFGIGMQYNINNYNNYSLSITLESLKQIKYNEISTNYYTDDIVGIFLNFDISI